MPLLALSHMAFFWRMSNWFIKESTKKWTLFKFSCYLIQCRHRIESLKGHFLNIIILYKLSWSTDQNNTNKQISQSRTTSLQRVSRWCGGPWFPLPSFLPLSDYSLPHLSRFSKRLTAWSWSCPTPMWIKVIWGFDDHYLLWKSFSLSKQPSKGTPGHVTSAAGVLWRTSSWWTTFARCDRPGSDRSHVSVLSYSLTLHELCKAYKLINKSYTSPAIT